ncbi:MAG: hypothetical protein ACOYUK_03345 [Patescibacteria group bacterium]
MISKNMNGSHVSPQRPPAVRRWWLWLIVIAIVIAAVSIPYLSVPAQCVPCPEEASYCLPCPTYRESVWQHFFN